MVIEPSQWLKILLKALTRVVVKYVLDQVRNGAQVVQIFDSMEMMINYFEDEDGYEGKMFEEWYIMWLKDIIMELKSRNPDLSIILFDRSAWWVVSLLYLLLIFEISTPYSPPPPTHPLALPWLAPYQQQQKSYARKILYHLPFDVITIKISIKYSMTQHLVPDCAGIQGN